MFASQAMPNIDFTYSHNLPDFLNPRLPDLSQAEYTSPIAKAHPRKNRRPLLELPNLHTASSTNSDIFEDMADENLMSASTFQSRSASDNVSGASRFDGLGITTADDPSIESSANSRTSQISPLDFEQDANNTPGSFPQKLSSPFNEHNILANASIPASYGQPIPYDFTTPDYTPISTHSSTYQLQTLSASRPPESPFELQNNAYYSTPRGATFTRPSLPQIATAVAATPISTSSCYATPVMQASPMYWTPQSTSSVYRGHPGFTPTSAHLPTAMLSYASPHPNQYMYDMAPASSIATYPPRRKPHLRPSLSESSVSRISSPARVRAASTGYHLQPSTFSHQTFGMHQQLPLPPLPPSVLVSTPHKPSQSPYINPRSQGCGGHCKPPKKKMPASPPREDFTNKHAPYMIPIRQELNFRGDLYTPKWKRRTPNGRWEGWCGDCVPGRWLDLKNSRYWEDKLRNHGICAKTKIKFDEPAQIRWVCTDGSIVVQEDGHSPTEMSDYEDTKRREGFCNTCKTWILMDGVRVKARGRAVSWWMHAYKVRESLTNIANIC